MIAPFVLERHFAEYEFSVAHQLSCSDCEPLAMLELLNMASPTTMELWNDLKISYTESSGHPLLRKEISSLYQDIDTRDILVCVPEEGIYLAMQSILAPGDHVVVISPAYQSLYEIAHSLGCSISSWEPDPDGSYNPQALKPLCPNPIRMLVINFPHNPTGSLISQDDLKEIAGFCQDQGIILFSDEMYRGLELDPDDRLCCAAELGDHVISLSGMSKSFALPGLRIGWLACKNPVIREKLVTLKDYTTICSSAPSEILAIIALQYKEQILERNTGIIRENIERVKELVNRYPVLLAFSPPKAGSVAMLHLKSGLTAEQLCQDLLDQQNVLAIGSHLFGMKGSAIRLGLGRKTFGDALVRLEMMIGDRRYAIGDTREMMNDE